MISSGTRIYSISEIKAMIKNGETEALVGYLSSAPNKIKEYVVSLTESSSQKDVLISKVANFCDVKQQKVEEQKILDVHLEFSRKDLVQEMNQVISDSSGVEQSSDIDVAETDDKLDISNENIADDKNNPYEDIDFVGRVDVNELHLWITDEDKCPLCNTEFSKAQVVTIFGRGKRYGLQTTCCNVCKRIYVSNEKIETIEPALKNKKDLIYCIHKN